jgi:hypothetical protein
MKEIKVKSTEKSKIEGCQQKLFPDKDDRLIELKEEEKKIYFNITKNREFTIRL